MTADAMARPRRTAQEPEWVVWITVLAMLAIGLAVRSMVTGRMAHFANGNIAFDYPADWMALASEDPTTVVQVGEPMDVSFFPASVSIRQMPVTDISTTANTPGDLAMKWSNRQVQELLGYRVLNVEPASVGGQKGVRIEYACVADPPLGGPNSIPIVAHGEDILIVRGDQLTVITWSAASDQAQGQAATWQRVLASMNLQ